MEPTGGSGAGSEASQGSADSSSGINYGTTAGGDDDNNGGRKDNRVDAVARWKEHVKGASTFLCFSETALWVQIRFPAFLSLSELFVYLNFFGVSSLNP
jgi:hypothetical protein